MEYHDLSANISYIICAKSRSRLAVFLFFEQGLFQLHRVFAPIYRGRDISKPSVLRVDISLDA